MHTPHKRPLKIYTVANTLSYNASTYYRLDVPLTTMEECGLPVEPIIDNGDPSIPDINRMAALTSSDINLFYQPVSENLLEQMRRLNSLLPAKDAAGDWRYPPSFVVDTDDDLFNVHPMNPAFKDLGIRMPNGRLLKPGDEVGMVDDNGQKRIMWKDGEAGFDIARNLAKMANYRELLANADGVTCSTPRSEQYVRDETSHPRTFVIDLRPHPEEIRILWQGSTTHFEDFYDIRQSLPIVIRRYPHVRFIIWGALHPWIIQNVPSDRFTYIPWCRYAEYKLRLSTIGHDIAIAPLRPHRFNQSRSAIKFYESAVLHHTPAFLGQGGETPYGDEVVDGETGLLWTTPREFTDKLCTLIENADLRTRLASASRDWLSEHRDAVKLAPKLYDFYMSLREHRAATTPLPSDDEWARRKDEILAAVAAQLDDPEPENANVPT
jgi:hypothetical protein